VEPAGLPQEGLEPPAREIRCGGGCGSHRKDGAGFAGTQAFALVGECGQDSGLSNERCNWGSWGY
jgi:hypothetical protein